MEGVVPLLLLIIGPFVPSFLWLAFFLRGDSLHPEPKRMILAAFNIGVFISIPVLLFQMLLQNAIGSSELFLLIGLALIEELFKFFGAFFLIRRNREFNEPIDAIVYMVTVALGFATVENFFITLNILQSVDPFPLTSALQTLALRFAGATLLHTLSASIIGYAWAKERFLHAPREIVIWAIILATFVHSLFNFLILQYEDSHLLIPSFLLVLTAFFIVNDFEKLRIARR